MKLRMLLLLAALAITSATVSARDWVVGQIGPFTGLPVPDAIQMGEGMAAYFALANERGGISGRRIEFFQLDDAYSPDVFEQRFHEAMARRPVALLAPLGSASVKRMLDARLLDDAEVVVLNAVPGAEALRQPGHAKLFHVRAGDRQQIEKIVNHVRTLGVQRLGVVHQDIPMGASGADAARAAVQGTAGMSIAAAQSAGDAAALDRAARTLVTAGVQGAIVIGAPKFSTDAIAALQRNGMRNATFALSHLVPTDLARTIGPAARGIGISQAMPNPMGVVLPPQREFQGKRPAKSY